MEEVTLKISGTIVAWYGAIVATVGIILSLYVALRDRANVKVSLQSDMFVRNHPHYNPSKIYLNVTVRNIGRRPVKIGSVALKTYGERGSYLLSDSVLNLGNRVLTEENPRTNFLVEQDNKIPKKVFYAVVYDEAGREYRGYHYRFPILQGLYFWIENLMGYN